MRGKPTGSFDPSPRASRVVAFRRCHAGAQRPEAFRWLRGVLFNALLCSSLAAAAPGGTNSAGGAAKAAGTGDDNGGTSAFFAPSTVNFTRPEKGWSNWSASLAMPGSERRNTVYLCYSVTKINDATMPFLLTSIERLRVHGDEPIPCYSLMAPKKNRPIRRGDRLRIAIDLSTNDAKAFFDHVSAVSLNVVLTVAPPVQVALLRANLGGSTTTAGLGGNQAPEPLDYDNPCVKQIIGLVPFDKGGCMGPGDDPPTILILSWPYTFPGDVIPAVTISALYAAPQDRGAPAAAESSPNRDKAATSTISPPTGKVVNLGVQQLTQVHAPSLWALSTALVFTTSRIPASYTFQSPVAGPNGCSATTTPCPEVTTSTQRFGDIALMVSPYLVHYLYSKFIDKDAPPGIDAESAWRLRDGLPEPVGGFGLTSIGSTFYAGASIELFVRNLQFMGGYAWIKAPALVDPHVSTSANTPATPATYTAFRGTGFVGVAFNIAGLFSGH